MFLISKTPIIVSNLQESTLDAVGGIVTFEGRVRNENQGRIVTQLEYEAFPEMAELEGSRIVAEAHKLFAIEKAFCIHRSGLLKIKDLAIWIGVYAKHREAAFRASEFIVDEVKTRVPIWKKEYYSDGESSWVKCLTCAAKGVSHYDHFHHVR